MRRILHILILNLFFAVSLSAQNLSVSSFALDETDLTANQHTTTVLDQNGDKCALIRVQTTQTGFTFDVGSLGVQKTIQKVGEIWLYVPHGVRKLTIRHQQLGTAMYSFPISVDKGRTYNMQLVSGEVQTIVKNAVTSQYVLFEVTPKDAIIEFDGQVLDVTDGTASRRVPFGMYKYKVSSSLYHSVEGSINVEDPNNKHIVNVDLKPAFGYISVPSTGTLSDAKVFVNDEFVGMTPFKSNKLLSGQYSVKIVKAMYEQDTQKVVVEDGKTVSVSTTLKPTFANVTFKTDDGAEIWVNEENKGKGVWEGQLAYGKYVVETKKVSHRTISSEIEITSDSESKTIALTSPTPIYGSFDINSKPANADIYINEVLYGQTPLQINEILIGDYAVKISKQGYESYQTNISVTEGETSTVESSLTKEAVNVVIKNGPLPTYEDTDEGDIFEVVEQGPSFPGGLEALQVWLGKNLHYPSSAQNLGIQGRVLVQFVVAKDGAIVNPRIRRSIAESYEYGKDEIEKTMKEMKISKLKAEEYLKGKYNASLLLDKEALRVVK